MEKNQIVILRNAEVVENMMSKIQTPKDLRKRLAKHFKGTHRIYFRSNGTFFVDGEEYQWMINPKGYSKPKKPAVLHKDVLLSPRPQNHQNYVNLQELVEYLFPYNLYPEDIIEFPELKDMQVISQEVRKGSRTKMYLVKALINSRLSWVSVNDMRYMFNDFRSFYDILTIFAGKRIRIDNVIKHEQCEAFFIKGMLTGRPIRWIVRPKHTLFHKTIEYTEL